MAGPKPFIAVTANPLQTKTMSIALTALALLAAGPPPPGEDAAHRQDRLRTEELNRAAAGHVTRRQAADDARYHAWQASQDDYARRMAAWRKRDAERRRYNDSLR